MASVNVIKRGSKWQFRFEGASIDGKRKWITKSGFRTKKEALEAGNKALAEYNRAGQHFEPSKISVSDYLDYWFDQYCKINLKYITQLGYINIIENHLKPKFGHYRLSAVTPSILTEYANELKVSGYSKSTATGILSTFSVAFDYAVEPLNFIAQNPMKYVRFPKIDRKPRERCVLDSEDWKRIMEKFPLGSRFHIPLMIGYHCGLRISETMGITWDDIDFENNTLSVNKQTVKRNYGVDARKVLQVKGKKEEKASWYFTSPKYDSGRVIKFGETLRKSLLAEKERQEKNEKEYGDFFVIHVIKEEKDEKGNTIHRIMPCQKAIQPTLKRVHLVCIAENGDFTTSDSMKYPSKIINKELLIRYEYHALRHTHATRLVESGVNIKAVQTRLGHKNIQTTLQTYAHTTEDMENEVISIFENNVLTN